MARSENVVCDSCLENVKKGGPAAQINSLIGPTLDLCDPCARVAIALVQHRHLRAAGEKFAEVFDGSTSNDAAAALAETASSPTLPASDTAKG